MTIYASKGQSLGSEGVHVAHSVIDKFFGSKVNLASEYLLNSNVNIIGAAFKGDAINQNFTPIVSVSLSQIESQYRFNKGIGPFIEPLNYDYSSTSLTLEYGLQLESSFFELLNLGVAAGFRGDISEHRGRFSSYLINTNYSEVKLSPGFFGKVFLASNSDLSFGIGLKYHKMMEQKELMGLVSIQLKI
jgi:hypothetical protein